MQLTAMRRGTCDDSIFGLAQPTACRVGGSARGRAQARDVVRGKVVVIGAAWTRAARNAARSIVDVEYGVVIVGTIVGASLLDGLARAVAHGCGRVEVRGLVEDAAGKAAEARIVRVCHVVGRAWVLTARDLDGARGRTHSCRRVVVHCVDVRAARVLARAVVVRCQWLIRHVGRVYAAGDGLCARTIVVCRCRVEVARATVRAASPQAAAVVDERKRPVVRSGGISATHGRRRERRRRRGRGTARHWWRDWHIRNEWRGRGAGRAWRRRRRRPRRPRGRRRRRRLRGDAQGHVAAAFKVALRRPAIIPTLGEFCAEPIVSLIERGAVQVPVAIAYRRDRDEYSGWRRRAATLLACVSAYGLHSFLDALALHFLPLAFARSLNVNAAPRRSIEAILADAARLRAFVGRFSGGTALPLHPVAKFLWFEVVARHLSRHLLQQQQQQCARKGAPHPFRETLQGGVGAEEQDQQTRRGRAATAYRRGD